jgi:hypothetical protein
MVGKVGRTIVMGKRGHPKRPHSEAAEFGRLVQAERDAGARTIGEAMTRVRRRDRNRWGSQRKMDGLWAEFKEIKRQEAAAARLAEKMDAQLAAFEHDMAKLSQQVDLAIGRIAAEFARRNPHVASFLNRLRKPTE